MDGALTGGAASPSAGAASSSAAAEPPPPPPPPLELLGRKRHRPGSEAETILRWMRRHDLEVNAYCIGTKFTTGHGASDVDKCHFARDQRPLDDLFFDEPTLYVPCYNVEHVQPPEAYAYVPPGSRWKWPHLGSHPACVRLLTERNDTFVRGAIRMLASAIVAKHRAGRNSKLAVVCACDHGKHRSVATGTLLVLVARAFGVIAIVDLVMRPHFGKARIDQMG